MSMNIYTTGSAEFLEIMLNAAAMITGSGTSEDLARIGLLIGLLILGFQAVFNGQAISFQKAGLALVLYLMFFGPTTTAVIEETTTGQVRVVENVPIGPTFVGSVISTVAYEITRVSEQAFSTPTMTDYGLFSSLNTIARVRDTLRNPMALEGFANYKANEGWNFPKSMDEFLTYCVLNPISLREFNDVDQLFRAGSANEVLTAPLSSQYVYLFDGPAGGRMVSCSEAQAVLQPAFVQVYQGLFDDILNRGFAPEKAAGKMNTGGEAEARVNDAIQSFAISAKNAQGYVASAVVMPIFNDSRVNALNHWQEKNAAMALRESINHQESQWAARGDLFKHYMRPMIAFFEGLLYAMTPFMAFAIVLGSPGLSVLGKYMMLPLAVGMWMPLLSIVNAFTLWYANAEISAILNSYDPTGPGFAMLQVLDMDQAISKALGIGGLLAASVPPLALFIVSGSAMVMNGIMTQASQGSTFKSEDLMPRAKNQGPVMSTDAKYTSDQMSQGAGITGSAKLTESFSQSQGAAAVVESRKAASESATQAFNENLATATQKLTTNTDGRQALAQLGNELVSTLAKNNQTDISKDVKKLESLGYTNNDIAAGIFTRAAGLNAGAGGGEVSSKSGEPGMGGKFVEGAKRAVGMIGGVAGVNLGTFQDSEQFQALSTKQQQEAMQAAARINDVLGANENNAVKFAAGNVFTNNRQASEATGNTDTLSSSLSQAVMADRAFLEASSRREEWSSGQNFNLLEAANKAFEKGVDDNGVVDRAAVAQSYIQMYGTSPEAMAKLRSEMNSTSLTSVSTDSDSRAVMAAIRLMNQEGRFAEVAESQYSPFNFDVNAGDAYSNRDVSERAATATQGASEIETKFVSGRSAADEAFVSEQAMSQDGYDATKADGQAVIEAQTLENRSAVSGQYDVNRQEIADTDYEQRIVTPNSDINTTTPVRDLGHRTVAIASGKGDEYTANMDQRNNKARKDDDGYDIRPNLTQNQLNKERGKGSNDDIPPFPNN